MQRGEVRERMSIELRTEHSRLPLEGRCGDNKIDVYDETSLP